MRIMDAWREVGDGVFVRRHEIADLNIGLVVGEESCLVIDTRMSHRQGRELAATIREITSLPWTVANTHGHYDHCFGNAVFLPADIWGHKGCADMLIAHGAVKKAYFRIRAAEAGDHEFADDLDEVEIVPPNRTFTGEAVLDLGGRAVRLSHLGRGHTDNDVVMEVPGTGVVFAGDLVEEGAPPVFSDSFPLEWPATLEALVRLAPERVVPGHGDVVEPGYVTAQAASLAEVARVAREAFTAGREMDDALRDVPLPEETARHALARAYRQLRGEPSYDSPEELGAILGVSLN
ncbi:MBL fold metallo-hydrolase [Streptosporangium sp. CA-135522]|uniref:MBL fold metallo-hydrolase n=1 Tax=Streptosporangium sp. CA-135522 TaxID=3240072 RepID=UPI003D9221EB